MLLIFQQPDDKKGETGSDGMTVYDFDADDGAELHES